MKQMEGSLSPRIDAQAILVGWSERYAAQGAPRAELETDGEVFRLLLSPNWDVASLRNAFEIEVHRINPDCKVSWL